MENVNSQVYAEVLILLNYYLRPEEFNKIPQEKIQLIANKADKDFVMDIDEEKTFEEQKISKRAKAIILGLYKKYFINDEQGKKLDQLLKYIETKPKETVNYNDRLKQISLEKKNELVKNEVVENTENKSLVEIGFFQKIINKLKNILKWRKNR